MRVAEFLNSLAERRDFRDAIRHVRRIDARPARFAEPATPIHDWLHSALARQGIEKLYTHQAAAVDAASPPQPKDIVVVTGTASGKTLCYNVPVINALLADPSARALYLFPTKALAQDQLGAIDRLCAADPGLGDAITASTYDGDTPAARRRAARHSANIILSNPDMLHASILPQHGSWAKERFLTHLRYVVIDEVHAYRGTFGSHVAGVLRRLRRLCLHYGCDPTFICCSATIANPGELASRLIGREVIVIDDDGSPRGVKFFVLWDPPFIDRSRIERRSANVETQRLMVELIRHGAQTIAFARARVVAELIYKYAVEELRRDDPKLADRIRPYRGGYLARQRREIEDQLFSGRLLGVCSTNALELGIDVGGLDAAIITGFPGTICSIWQQAGRAGRSREESLAVFVAYNDPIDQYFMRHPDYFFGQSPEHAAIDPLNPTILESQIKCAAQELPLCQPDTALFGTDLAAECARFLETASPDDVWHGVPEPRGTTMSPSEPRPSGSGLDDASAPVTPAPYMIRFNLKEGRLPHHRVSLRLMSSETFDIIDVTGGGSESVGNVDFISAPELVYPNAVYIHEGENYMVRELDFDARIARVQRTDVDYYTQAVLADHCRVTGTLDSRALRVRDDDDARSSNGMKHFGRLDVTWQTIAFKKIKYYTLEVIGQDALDLPPQTIHTTGVWATLPKWLHAEVAAAGYRPIEAMVGIRNLLLVTLPMLAMCDRRDISGCVDSANLGELAMFLYDRYEGGLGYAKLGFTHFEELLKVCQELVTDCPCTEGCPSCVGLANVRPPQHTDPDVGPSFAIPSKAACAFAFDRWLA